MTTIDEQLSWMRALRDSIWRDRRLLQGRLTESDRAIVEKRLLEQRLAFDKLLASAFPIVFKIPNQADVPAPSASRKSDVFQSLGGDLSLQPGSE
jgi:hypothetical protein